METRKVQKSGNSSFVVSLPAGWAKAYKVGKNSPVGVAVNPDGTLTIRPSGAAQEKDDVAVFDFSGGIEPTPALRKLIGAYIYGTDTLEIRFSHATGKQARLLAEKFISMTVGFEVVDETEKRIVVKDILSPSEMPLSRILSRMHVISRKMLSGAISCLQDGGDDAPRAVRALDRDVDRLFWLMARKHNLFLRKPSAANAEGMALSESRFHLLTATQIERISDHAVRLAEQSARFSGSRKAKKEVALLSGKGAKVLSLYDKSIKAFYSRDPLLANSAIDESLALEAGFREILASGIRLKPDLAIAFAYSLESIKRAAEYSVGICENVIDLEPSP